MSYRRDVEKVSEFARKAGEIVMQVYSTDFGVDFKSGNSPVTEADRLANTYLVDAIANAFPGDGIVAEESADASDAMNKGRCWFIDPLDGTKEFIAKNGEFSIMLGLAIDGRAQLGVIYQPSRDKLYAGVVGEGAKLICGGRTQTLRVSEHAHASELRFVGSRSHRSKQVDALLQRLQISRAAVSGSVGLKIGLLAERQADVYVHFSDKSCVWDACGPDALLRAAGGRFTDLAGQDFSYRTRDVRNRRGIMACNAAFFPQLLPVARAIAEESGLVFRS